MAKIVKNEQDALELGLQALVSACHTASKEGGWWHEKGASLLKDKYVHGTKIALIHSEISEMMEGVRKGLTKMDDHLPHRPMAEVEAADAVIRIADICGALGLDLAGAVVEKMAYNAQRADHKPEARAAEGGKSF